jgi:hypothetical protein
MTFLILMWRTRKTSPHMHAHSGSRRDPDSTHSTRKDTWYCNCQPVVMIGHAEGTCDRASCNCNVLQVCCINATVTYCKCAVSICKWAPLLATYPSGSDKVGPILLQLCCACVVSSVLYICSCFRLGFALRVTHSDLHFAWLKPGSRSALRVTYSDLNFA